MLMIELKARNNTPVAQFAIVPMGGLPDSFAFEQYQNAKYLARATGTRFFFLVMPDRVFGWEIGNQKPFFSKRTVELLSSYAASPSDVGVAREQYLAELVDAWLADLKTHWRSGGQPAPGEAALSAAGLTQALRSNSRAP